MTNRKFKRRTLAQEKAAFERNEQQKLYDQYCDMHDGKPPMNRRDFLAAGIIPFAASVTLPAFGQAVECPEADTGGDRLSAFFHISCAGGAMLAANYLPTDQGRQPLPSYTKMGMGLNPGSVTEFANDAVFYDGSQVLAGIQATTAQSTRNRTVFLGIPNRSNDDTSGNSIGAEGMLSAAGLRGNIPMLGSVRHNNAAIIQRPNSLNPGSVNDILAALGAANTGPLAYMDETDRAAFARLIHRLSRAQTAEETGNTGGDQMRNLVVCGNEANLDLAENPPPPPDARLSPELQAIWGVNPGDNANDNDAVRASMAFAALRGLTGPVGYQIGGCDYHNGTRTSGDAKDLEIGQYIGRILESAAQLGEKVFIHVSSDGSCVGPEDTTPGGVWRSDRGGAGIMYAIAYDPAGAPSASDHQIGHFSDAQVADSVFVTGGSPELASAAVFANYCMFNDREDLIEEVIPGQFTPQQLDQILKIG